MERNDIYRETWDVDIILEHRENVGWAMSDFHTHNHFEIYLTLTDNVKIFVNDSVYYLTRGSLLVFNNKDRHRVDVPADINYIRYITSFKPEYISGLSDLDTDLLDCFINRGENFSHMVVLSKEELDVFLRCFDKAFSEYKSPSYGSTVKIKIALAEMLLLMNPLYGTEARKNTKEYPRMQPILRYIHENLYKGLTLEELSARFYMSAHNLEVLFKKAVGFSINQYIIEKRMLKAKELLKGGLSVKETALNTGFNSTSHFIRMFKKKVGITPKQYGINGLADSKNRHNKEV